MLLADGSTLEHATKKRASQRTQAFSTQTTIVSTANDRVGSLQCTSRRRPGQAPPREGHDPTVFRGAFSDGLFESCTRVRGGWWRVARFERAALAGGGRHRNDLQRGLRSFRSSAFRATSDLAPTSCEWQCVAAQCALLSVREHAWVRPVAMAITTATRRTSTWGTTHSRAASSAACRRAARALRSNYTNVHRPKGDGRDLLSWTDCRTDAQCTGGVCVAKAVVGASCKDVRLRLRHDMRKDDEGVRREQTPRCDVQHARRLRVQVVWNLGLRSPSPDFRPARFDSEGGRCKRLVPAMCASSFRRPGSS